MTTTPTRPVAGLSEDAHGDRVPTAWERARRRVDLEDPVVSWAASLGVTLIALFLRLWKLGTPKVFEFDETYYAKDAWSLLHHGYAQGYVDGANDKILDGTTTGLWTGDPSMVVHPEVGKWLIALGEWAFGMDPFGWRIASAVVGSLMVLVMCRLVRRMTGSTALGLIGGALLSLDGLQFVLSRLALLDIFLAFFILLAVHCLVADRDWYRAKMARLVPEQIVDGGAYGPVRGLLFRPWLLASGVCWGLAIGTKWTAVYPLAAFGVMVWLWSAGSRRSFGVRWATLRSVVVDGVPAFVHLVLVGVVVYTATWTGWLVHAHDYERTLSSTQYTQFIKEQPCKVVTQDDGTTETQEANLDNSGARWPTATEKDAHGVGELWQSLRSLWYYHQDVYTFHTHFLNCSSHPYQSKPSGWLFLDRPVGVAAENGIKPGTQGCQAPADSTCLRQVLLIGTPTIWWGGILALVYAVLMWVGGRDWRFGVAVVGTASTWLPWLQYDTRPIFLFYAVAILPFVVLALTLTAGKLLGRSRAPSPRRTAGTVAVGVFLVFTVLNFAWFWPIFTNELLTRSEWLDRIWFHRWI
ncbi:phospholipid carrier-dependent glycosyltransferase [Nocardioides anomalus]|uniref:Polyprenol-phosphate-mannose--protein mannosyltransferase n=1 Tax=Nocardioides anomalus TaxID=2712223 RepID=A0A6G6W826_9ACTN|nr:phospholipid carrier-dependent glycosyltransferase [Nocardioides anomalus]QIG41488.1 phospholipid carrier-dependent glycosyltransferase [Nocardioides anomalus]